MKLGPFYFDTKEMFLVILAAVVMGLDLTLPESRRRQLGLVTAVGLFAAVALSLIFSLPDGQNGLIFGGTLRNDFASFLFRIIFMFSAVLTCATISTLSANATFPLT